MKYTAKHYADALRETAGDPTTVRQLIADLASVAEHLATDPAIRSFFTSRTSPVARQEKILHDVFQDFLSQRTYAFLKALIANRQVRLLDRITAIAEQLADTEEGTARVVVESAKGLAEITRTRIESVLATRLQRRIVAEYRACPPAIAGLRITIDGTLRWDATVEGKLQRLHERIRAAA